MKKQKIKICWVGISQKIYERNLSPLTLTGKIIKEIEEKNAKIESLKTNLVEFAPLDKNKKLRYPTKEEIADNFQNLWQTILKQKPQKIFFLGELVRKSFEQNLKISIKKPNNFEYFQNKYQNMVLVAIQHPSYIAVYKKKQKVIFIEKISEQILI